MIRALLLLLLLLLLLAAPFDARAEGETPEGSEASESETEDDSESESDPLEALRRLAGIGEDDDAEDSTEFGSLVLNEDLPDSDDDNDDDDAAAASADAKRAVRAPRARDVSNDAIEGTRRLRELASAEDASEKTKAVAARLDAFDQRPEHTGGRMNAFERLQVGDTDGRLAQHMMNVFSVLPLSSDGFAENAEAFLEFLDTDPAAFRDNLGIIEKALNKKLGERLQVAKGQGDEARLAESEAAEIGDALRGIAALIEFSEITAEARPGAGPFKSGRRAGAHQSMRGALRAAGEGFFDNLTGGRKEIDFRISDLERIGGGANTAPAILNYDWASGAATQPPPPGTVGNAIFKEETPLAEENRQPGERSVGGPINFAANAIRNDQTWRSGLRQEATYAIAEALGLRDLVVRTKFVNLGGTYGAVQEMAPGAGPREAVPGRPAGSLADRPTADFTEAARRPALWRNLNNAEWLDLLTGQVDRNPGNYFITRAGGVKLIDSDQAFGHSKDPFIDSGTLPPRPAFIDRALLGQFRRTSSDQLRRLVAGRLNGREQDALVARYEALRAHALTLEGSGAVIGDVVGPFGQTGEGRGWLAPEVVAAHRTGERYYHKADESGDNFRAAFPDQTQN